MSKLPYTDRAASQLARRSALADGCVQVRRAVAAPGVTVVVCRQPGAPRVTLVEVQRGAAGGADRVVDVVARAAAVELIGDGDNKGISTVCRHVILQTTGWRVVYGAWHRGRGGGHFFGPHLFFLS